MRSLGEILEDANDGKMPTLEECYYALVMMSSMRVMDMGDLCRMEALTRVDTINTIWDRGKRLLKVSPKHFLGDTYDPLNPEVQKRRKVSKKLWNHFSKKCEEKSDDNNVQP